MSSNGGHRSRRRPLARRFRESFLALVLGVTVGLVVIVATGVPEAGGGHLVDEGAVAAAVGGGVQLDPTVPDADTTDELVGDRVRNAVAEGCGARRQGTVVWVAHDGVPRWWTNRHVAAGAATVDTGPGGPREVVGSLDGVDVATALASTSDADLPALEVGPAPVVGTGVVVVGYPDGRRAAVAGRVVAVERRVDRGRSASVIVVDAPAAPGSSGGAVVDGAGRIVGLVAARDPGTGRTVALPMADLALVDVLSGPPSC
jgi:hypothetical protein